MNSEDHKHFHSASQASDREAYRQAYQSRDSRFDGQFFLAVKTTGIYCRPICPATTPKQENVEYFDFAHQAVSAGYRACLRCHPDSAPGSPIWNGVSTSLTRAKRLIDNGSLEHGGMEALSSRLGISDRYLRQLFDRHLGISPKAYALFKQCDFAKNLLHQTNLPITEIALSSGFGSVRRFNDCFKKQFSISPSDIRKNRKPSEGCLTLKLHYRPPYQWQHLQTFLSSRIIEGLEWCDADSYGRTFQWMEGDEKCQGRFTARHKPERCFFEVKIDIDNLRLLKPVVNNIRRILDLDTDSASVEACLAESGIEDVVEGLRLPGTWSVYEAGIRAILGQQISVSAAKKYVTAVVSELGEKTIDGYFYFPTAESMSKSDFEFIKMPGARKQTLRNLAEHTLCDDFPEDTERWLSLKGIGPWTVNYAQMRGLSDPDIYLGGDLGVKKAMQGKVQIDPRKATPFRSYLTFQLWNQL